MGLRPEAEVLHRLVRRVLVRPDPRGVAPRASSSRRAGPLYALFIVVAHFALDLKVQGWASLMVVLLVVSGAQLLVMGMIGEYLWRNLDETRRRPRYVVETVLRGRRVRAERLRPFLVLAAAVLGLGLLLYAHTFGASFAADDMDYLNEAADVRAGAVGFGTLLFRPHHEHLVPALRLAVQASVALFGVSALPFRLAVFLAHAAAAVFLALLARRYARRNASMIAAGAAAMASGGLASLVVWFPTAGFVPVAMAGLAGAAAALAWQERLGTLRARLLATAGIALALASESTFAPLVAFPVLVDALERRAAGKRAVSAFGVLLLAGSAAWVLASREIFMRLTGRLFVLDVRHGIPRGVFLLLAAPYRLFFPGAPIPVPPGTEGLPPFVACLAGLALAAAFAALVRRGFAREHRPLLAVFAAALAVFGALVLLAGLGRARYAYWELYDADRYFYALLPPSPSARLFSSRRGPRGSPAEPEPGCLRRSSRPRSSSRPALSANASRRTITRRTGAASRRWRLSPAPSARGPLRCRTPSRRSSFPTSPSRSGTSTTSGFRRDSRSSSRARCRRASSSGGRA